MSCGRVGLGFRLKPANGGGAGRAAQADVAKREERAETIPRQGLTGPGDGTYIPGAAEIDLWKRSGLTSLPNEARFRVRLFLREKAKCSHAL